MAGEDFARLVLLLLFAAAFVNVTRGTFRDWLRAKFIGQAAGGSGIAAAAPAGTITLQTTPTAASPAARGAGAVATAARPRVAAARRDMSLLKPTDQFSTPAIVAAAIRHAPRGQVPHQVMHEGVRIVNGKRVVDIKYLGPAGGNTITIPLD